MSATNDQLVQCQFDAQAGNHDAGVVPVSGADLKSVVAGTNPCLPNQTSNLSAGDGRVNNVVASHDEQGVACDLSPEILASSARTLHSSVSSISPHRMQPQRTSPMPPPVSIFLVRHWRNRRPAKHETWLCVVNPTIEECRWHRGRDFLGAQQPVF
jgi:hypothetical protein